MLTYAVHTKTVGLYSDLRSQMFIFAKQHSYAASCVAMTTYHRHLLSILEESFRRRPAKNTRP